MCLRQPRSEEQELKRTVIMTAPQFACMSKVVAYKPFSRAPSILPLHLPLYYSSPSTILAFSASAWTLLPPHLRPDSHRHGRSALDQDTDHARLQPVRLTQLDQLAVAQRRHARRQACATPSRTVSSSETMWRVLLIVDR